MSYHFDIMKLTQENTDFRRVIATNPHSQVVLMSIPAQEEIGYEVHKVDQLLYIIQGTAQAVVADKQFVAQPNNMIIVPAGTFHNIINIGPDNLKLFTIYAPAQHKPGTIQATKQEVEAY